MRRILFSTILRAKGSEKKGRKTEWFVKKVQMSPLETAANNSSSEPQSSSYKVASILKRNAHKAV